VFGKPQKKNLQLADASANDKKRIWDLPNAGQTSKKYFKTCRQSGKRQKKILRLAQSWANIKKRF